MVRVGLGVAVKVAVAVEVRVLVAVAVGLAEMRLVGIEVEVGEFDAVGEGVRDGLVVGRSVGSTDGRRVEVGVGVMVASSGVSLGMAEGSGESVMVGDGV